MTKRLTAQERRSYRTRNKLQMVNINRNPNREIRMRLSVNRTGKHISAQVIDDITMTTVAWATSQDKELKSKNGANKDAATAVGKLVAARALKAGVKKVVFDRGSCVYHGRVQALADGAREGGLEF